MGGQNERCMAEKKGHNFQVLKLSHVLKIKNKFNSCRYIENNIVFGYASIDIECNRHQGSSRDSFPCLCLEN